MAKMLEISKISNFPGRAGPQTPQEGRGLTTPFLVTAAYFTIGNCLLKKTYETPAVVLSVLFVDGPTERIYIL